MLLEADGLEGGEARVRGLARRPPSAAAVARRSTPPSSAPPCNSVAAGAAPVAVAVFNGPELPAELAEVDRAGPRGRVVARGRRPHRGLGGPVHCPGFPVEGRHLPPRRAGCGKRGETPTHARAGDNAFMLRHTQALTAHKLQQRPLLAGADCEMHPTQMNPSYRAFSGLAHGQTGKAVGPPTLQHLGKPRE